MIQILISTFSTLVVTVVGSLIINYFSRQRYKITYSIRESKSMGLDENKKYIAINLIEFKSLSSACMEDIKAIINIPFGDIQKLEIESTNGCKVEKKEISNNQVELSIPLFNKDDKVSVSILLENSIRWNGSSSIFFRSKKNIIVINENEINEGEHAFGNAFRLGILVSVFVLLALVFTTLQTISPQKLIPILMKDTQRDNLTFAASICDLPDLALAYSTSKTLKYYNQGDMIFALAKTNSNVEEYDKYIKFLNKTIEISSQVPKIADISKCALNYNIAKIYTLKKDNDNIQKYLKYANDLNDDEVEKRLKVDSDFYNYLQSNKILY